MPKAGKIFLYREDLTFEQILEKLQGYREENEYQTEEDYLLVTDIDVALGGDEIQGTYRFDGVDERYHRSGIQTIAYTTEAKFLFFEDEAQKFVLIMVAKRTANTIANALSIILHGVVGAITEPKLNPEMLRKFCEGSEAIKVLLFDEIDIPNLDKTTLYGANVVQMDLYNQFVDSGLFRYSVTKLSKDGYTVGIVRDGSVCIFNSVDTSEYVSFIKTEIIPMILRRS